MLLSCALKWNLCYPVQWDGLLLHILKNLSLLTFSSHLWDRLLLHILAVLAHLFFTPWDGHWLHSLALLQLPRCKRPDCHREQFHSAKCGQSSPRSALQAEPGPKSDALIVQQHDHTCFAPHDAAVAHAAAWNSPTRLGSSAAARPQAMVSLP